MRLIDADELLKRYGFDKATKYGNEDKKQQDFSYSTMMMYEIADMIEDAPTVDAVEQKHGHWIDKQYHTSNGKILMQCSACRRLFTSGFIKTPENPNKHFELQLGNVNRYCPNCGAKMDEVKE